MSNFEDEENILDLDDLGLSDDFITITVQELILIVYDASGSMKEHGSSGQPKYKEAEIATNGFINRLQLSRAASSFHIAVAIFNDDVTEILPPTPVLELPAEDAVSLPKPSGNTNLDAGLEWAENLAEKFIKDSGDIDSDVKKAAIVVLSDGRVNRGEDPSIRGQRLANLHTVGAGAFGNAAEEVLKGIVTVPDLFKRDPSPEDLRALLERSTLRAMRN
ncbi:MAG: VWA domain-containing protein [Candidatus Heimdallarchaeota archaeon]|nr:VWA domain-containing protein [Candidatus Heimdallarchaeota archaeon]MDH5647732.1 VWA domain-containing protein [Candidatus Heimdallarchaeota archaeon]